MKGSGWLVGWWMGWVVGQFVAVNDVRKLCDWMAQMMTG